MPAVFMMRPIMTRKKKDDGLSHSLRNMGVASTQEAIFVFAVGLLLSLNSGFINGLCLSGLLTKDGSLQQAVSSVTGTYTRAGLSLAHGDVGMFGMDMGLILCFIAGSTISGFMNPKAIPHKLVPSYGPTFLIGSLCMIAACIAGTMKPGDRTLYYFATMANGIQNGMSSTYTANLIRTSHLTGTSTDIGLILGQMLRGNWKNYWKFKVLIGLAISFWVGSLVSFFSAAEFLSHSLIFSAALFLLIGLTHLTFVVITQHVSFAQAAFGTWQWDKVLGQLAKGVHDTAITAMTPEQIDQVFDSMDVDKSGDIQAHELIEALEKLGMKVTEDVVESMIAVVDVNGDGSVDREEFHTLVQMTATRARKKKEKRGMMFQFKNATITETDRMESDESLTKSDETKCQDDEENVPPVSILHQLPRTLQEALYGANVDDDRAIIVTETTPPFAVVGVNKAWEDACGHVSSGLVQLPLLDVIQKLNGDLEGIDDAMEQLANGAEPVEWRSTHTREDGIMFNRVLTLCRLFDDTDSSTEQGVSETPYYVGMLENARPLVEV